MCRRNEHGETRGHQSEGLELAVRQAFQRARVGTTGMRHQDRFLLRCGVDGKLSLSEPTSF